jgi:hypothetical protein
MQHRILLTVKTDDNLSIEDAIIKINNLISSNEMKLIEILPRCPYDQYPYGQSCCKQECGDDT